MAETFCAFDKWLHSDWLSDGSRFSPPENQPDHVKLLGGGEKEPFALPQFQPHFHSPTLVPVLYCHSTFSPSPRLPSVSSFPQGLICTETAQDSEEAPIRYPPTTSLFCVFFCLFVLGLEVEFIYHCSEFFLKLKEPNFPTNVLKEVFEKLRMGRVHGGDVLVLGSPHTGVKLVLVKTKDGAVTEKHTRSCPWTARPCIL